MVYTVYEAETSMKFKISVKHQRLNLFLRGGIFAANSHYLGKTISLPLIVARDNSRWHTWSNKACLLGNREVDPCSTS